MYIIARVVGVGAGGANHQMSFEWVATNGFSGGGEVYVDPTWTTGEIEAQAAEAVREALRQQGETVPEGTPVLLVGGVVKL